MKLRSSNPKRKRNDPAKRSASSSGYVVADTETTGFHPKVGAEIIRIEALKVMGQGRRTRYKTLVKLKRKLPQYVPAITGITQKQLNKKGKSLAKALDEFFRFVRGRRLVIFNAEFEAPFWKAATVRCGMAMPSPIVCLLKMAKKAWPGMKSYNARYLASCVPTVKKRALRLRSDCALQAAVYEAARAKLRLPR